MIAHMKAIDVSAGPMSLLKTLQNLAIVV